MAGLSADSYKGSRDWYPEDMRVRNYIFDIWRKVAKSYGYESYDAPLLEPVNVYAAKSGQELVGEQTYQFTDRGDRHVAIRPEMTPSVSRMIARRRQEIAYPARWFSIAQFMRYERPQRGREREFWQLNCDIFGADGVMAEAEVIGMGDQILKKFGAKPEMYTIRLNNRRIINYMMAHYLGLDAIQAELMIKLFDRKDKLPPETFRDQAIDIFGVERAKEGLTRIAKLITVKTIDELPEEIKQSDAARELGQLIGLLSNMHVTNVVFDITLMRGFDYYTGTVFEFFDTHPDNNRALFGGGRYDGLVGLFGAEPVSAVGFAPGLTPTELFLTSHRLLPKFGSSTDVYVIVLGEALNGALSVAADLRKESVNVELDFTGRKIDRQLKTAIKKKIPYILIVGEDELKTETYPLKRTATGEERKLSVERIVSTIKDRRHHQIEDEDEFNISDFDL